MENTSLIALSRAATLERQMNVVANNVANMNTTGFKSEAPLFTEFLVEPRREEKYSMVQDKATLRDLAPGAFTQTGNSLDVALEGHGYLTVGTLDGPRYTRNGNLTMDSNRQLVTSGGLPVLDETGNPITIPNNAGEIRISPEGSVTTNLGIAGKLGVVKFQKEQAMVQLGSGLYQTDETPTADPETIVRQGFLEGSNVKSIVEMTNMIEINRDYQNIQKLLQTEHDRLRTAYQKISKLT